MITHDVEPPVPAMADTLSVWPKERAIEHEFTTEFGILLQALPSATCLTHPVPRVLMLGRDLHAELEDALDLAALNALTHGVSRHHCLLQRSGTSLVVIDLGSTNGTYLNNLHLHPHEPYRMADGDRLILGSLHMIVSFARFAAP